MKQLLTGLLFMASFLIAKNIHATDTTKVRPAPADDVTLVLQPGFTLQL